MSRFSMILAALAWLTAGPMLGAAAQSSGKSQGADLFKQNCLACHGDKGEGSPLGKHLNVPDLRSKEIHQKTTAELVETVTKGKGKMPAFGGALSTEQVNAVIEYVRSLSPARDPK